MYPARHRACRCDPHHVVLILITKNGQHGAEDFLARDSHNCFVTFANTVGRTKAFVEARRTPWAARDKRRAPSSTRSYQTLGISQPIARGSTTGPIMVSAALGLPVLAARDGFRIEAASSSRPCGTSIRVGALQD